MYECPNCGGDLRFDIASQKLKCNHCESSFDPYEQEKQADAVESTDDEYQVTVFTCPECGAEIESTNLSAAGFCSYCGGAVVFSSRVQKEKRPAKIIPFRVTKEDCRKSYLSMIKRTPYTPKELKDPKYLERFVGFYLPYWSFRSKTEREVHVDGVKRTRRGDYIYVDHYHLSGKLDASYDGVSYDASSSFDDGISQRIAPFSTKNMVDFAPSFLLGFYADTADVPVEIYQNEAYTTIAKDIVRRLLSSQGFQKGGIKVESSATAQIRNEIAGDISSERMMFPIWFLTYRKSDRLFRCERIDRDDLLGSSDRQREILPGLAALCHSDLSASEPYPLPFRAEDPDLLHAACGLYDFPLCHGDSRDSQKGEEKGRHGISVEAEG